MSARAVMKLDSVPALRAHMQLRFDKVRATWTIQAPERAFLLDEIAHAIVTRCDGRTSISGIVDDLCGVYPEAPREQIAADVLQLVQTFIDKGVMAS